MDAGLAVKAVAPEPDSAVADALFVLWIGEGARIIAPPFFDVETDSILRQKVALRSELTVEQAELAFAKLRGLPIHKLSVPGQRQRAWEIATAFVGDSVRRHVSRPCRAARVRVLDG